MNEPISKDLTMTMTLRCELTAQRHRALEDEMAKAKTELDRLDEELERIREEHKAKRKKLEQQLRLAATISHQGFEMLPVPVTKTYDLNRNHIVIQRLDTKAIVADRAMENTERDEYLAYVSKEKQKEAHGAAKEAER